MGEVGTNSPDSPNINIKMNGINGIGRVGGGEDGEEDEPMDVDSQEESQESSEISTKKSELSSDAADVSSTTAITKEKTAIDGEAVTMDDDEDLLKGAATNAATEEEDEGDEDDLLDDENDSEKNSNGQKNHDEEDALSNQSGASESQSTTVTQENGQKEDEDKDSEEDEDEEEGKAIGDDEADDGDDDITQDSLADGENGIAVANVDGADEMMDDEDGDAEVPEEKNPLDVSGEDKTNKSINGDAEDSGDGDDVEHIPIVQEVHAISDSSDDEDDGKDKPAIEAMEVDGGVGKSNGFKDDDKPVSIHSDSDSDDKPSNKNGNSEVHEILSDKEDCVVIEDDKKEGEDDKDISPRRSMRARKSVVKVKDFSAFDDEIEEVVEDPLSQPAAKKAKVTNNMPMGITIQDARSLATDPLTAPATNASFQQNFIQSQGLSSKKEPTLVIIDTNQIMARGGGAATAQALQNKSFSMSPVGVPAQGIYPPNVRGASITPVIPKTIIQKSSPQTASYMNNTNTLLKNQPLILPELTDDMFVLEAPSFIVPYIYEKPPAENLKDIVVKIGIELEEQRKKDAETAAAAAAEEDAKEKSDDGKSDDADAKKDTKKRKSKRVKSGDDSWDESDTSTDDEASDSEQQTKVLISEANHDLDLIKTHIIKPSDPLATTKTDPAAAAANKDNYFDSPLGKFFMDIGLSLVHEHDRTDMLRQLKKKIGRKNEDSPDKLQVAFNIIKEDLDVKKKENEVFKFENKRCEYCSYKSESSLAMANHYETPHMNNQMYKCNFCPFETRPPYDILFHMEAVHNIKARLEKAQSYHQCPNCPFEDNGKSKLARHTLVCGKKFRPETNLNPPLDWEPPAKIPRIKPRHGLVGTATAYQAMAAQAQRAASASALARQNSVNTAAMMRARGRPQVLTKTTPGGTTILRTNQQQQHQQQQQPQRQQNNMIVPNNYASQYIQVIGAAGMALNAQINHNSNQNAYLMQSNQAGPKSSKQQQPSISITPLPRQPSASNAQLALQAAAAASMIKPPGAGNMKPGQTPAGGKASFVICEICDGYIKDLDQLRNHMQWMHKVKIHPKMIYNRPPLNCQKCQFRFFTDQGLERHLLGSHGLVTSSMQEAANKGKDAGRCPVCGRMYQWKLLNHVSRDHNMTLKPAHLSYKCTVCTATFGMYKQFENHVYSAHSTVAKKAMDGKNKNAPVAGGSKSGGGHNSDSLLKPLKINDEITIIPQPTSRKSNMDSHVIEIL